jgi:hypothetical protein
LDRIFEVVQHLLLNASVSGEYCGRLVAFKVYSAADLSVLVLAHAVACVYEPPKFEDGFRISDGSNIIFEPAN